MVCTGTDGNKIRVLDKGLHRVSECSNPLTIMVMHCNLHFKMKIANLTKIVIFQINISITWRGEER